MIGRAPRHADALHMRGLLALRAGHPQPAFDLISRAIAVAPSAFMHFNRAVALARLDRLDDAVADYAAAPPTLHALLRTLSPTIELIPAPDTPPHYDYQCPLLSLPRAFRSAIAAMTPYLAAEPARARRWREHLGSEGFRIGVCWQGSTLPYADIMQRSFPLAELAPLTNARADVRLISLQKYSGLDQLETLPPGMRVEAVEAFDEGSDAFIDTAALMTACDLIITADTSVAHLAGALGVPVWVALPWLADWRWLENRDDSPWYPSMRLFRKPQPSDWATVFAAMASALRKL